MLSKILTIKLLSMKKFLLIGLFLIFSLPSFSQALTNSTYYKSNITVYSGGTSDTYAYYFYVTAAGEVRQIDYAKNQFLAFKTYGTVSNAQSSVYSWANDGGVWSETQTFVFTKDKTSGKLYVFSVRVVQNEGEEPWQTYGVGDVEKL